MKQSLSSALCLAFLAVGALLTSPGEALACRTSVGDFVWLDSNGNGIQDPGEPGINGITVHITADHITPERWVVTANKPGTNDPGYYEFAVLCDWDYVISVDASTVPAGYSPSPIGVGSNPAIDSNNHAGTLVNVPMVVFGTPPPADLSFDFGYTPACSGKIGDFVWSDLDNNGIQDSGEPAIVGAVVSLNSSSPVGTDGNGKYSFGGLCAGTYTVCVQIPPGSQPSPAFQGSNAAIDSNGTSDGHGSSCSSVTLPNNNTVDNTIDFGMFYPPVAQPGTGTPGFWKNHPDAWPVDVITIGGVDYTKAQAIAWLDMPDGDKSLTMFRSLVAATLNVMVGNDSSCVSSTITSGNAWMAANGPAGSKVKASSLAWKIGEPMYRTLDNYNNGMLCAPHRE